MTSDLTSIKETFSFFDSWEDKYRFVIDLGKELPELSPAEKTEEHLVRGCQSQVWLVSNYDSDNDVVSLRLDSDAHIVRGLIAIVLAAYDRRTPAEIAAFDIEALFAELALLPHLSASRGNGLRAMVSKVQAIAKRYAAC